MTGAPTLLLGVLLLAAGTLALRLTGPALRQRIKISLEQQTLVDRAVCVLFCALVATSTLLQQGELAGPARPLGVLVAGILAWRRSPFVLTVLAAAGSTAGLRLLGVP